MEQEIVDTQSLSCLAHCVDVTKTGIRLGGGFVSSFGIGKSFHWFLLLLLLSEHIEVKKTSISKDAVKVFSHPIFG